MTPNQRSLQAKAAAHVLHSKRDSKELTANARAAFLGRFLDEVDKDRVLPEGERNRRAEHAKKAYFTKLAMQSSQARSNRSSGRSR